MNPVVEFAEAYLHASVQYRTFEDACRRLRDCGDAGERRSLVDATLRLAMSVTESIDDAESRLTDASAFVRINGADSRLTEDMRLASGILKENRARASSYAMAVASRRMGGPLPEPRRPQASNPFVFEEESEDAEESVEEIPEEDSEVETEDSEEESEDIDDSEDDSEVVEEPVEEDSEEIEETEEDSDDSEDDNSEDESIIESVDEIEEPDASEESTEENPLAAETERIMDAAPPVPPAKLKRRSLIGRLRRWRASRPSSRSFSPSSRWEPSNSVPASAGTSTSSCPTATP